MPKKRAPEVPPSADRMAWIDARMVIVARDIMSARKSQSWQALSALERQLYQYRTELDRLHAAQDAVSPEDASTMDPEEWAERVRSDASAAQDADLEVYVHEWAQRMGRVIVADGDEIRVVRRRTA